MIDNKKAKNDPNLTGDGSTGSPYEVLARKYRPRRFSDLIGQDALVRTLGNAFSSGRVAHAFLLTGVRGVGKTTTARIIARALNCTNPGSAKSSSAIEPCGTCENCSAITTGSHVDVLEMDAASRTGVDDIRELIEGVRYLPTFGRYKVYIIDEVHMLSINAFNALLKTLEEPPPRVKFIFATTEVRKIPVTVISRCQRFDLRRVDVDTLIIHFSGISKAEGATFDEKALGLIVRAADGSVRDGLSLLDQAINHASGGTVSVELVREMIGLADQARVCDLFEALLKGQVEVALSMFKELYQAGAEPVLIVQDLLSITHWLTMLKVEKNIVGVVSPPEIDLERGRSIAEKVGMADLTRIWQILLKGYNELQFASSDLEAAEMLLVRLAFVADLPSPADLVRELTGAVPATEESKKSQKTDNVDSDDPGSGTRTSESNSSIQESRVDGSNGAMPGSFSEVVQMFADKGEMRLFSYLQDYVHLIEFAPGKIQVRLGNNTPGDLVGNLSKHLYNWTGQRWAIELSDEVGQPTIAEQTLAWEDKKKSEVAQRPEVQALLQTFPGAEVTKVKARNERNPRKPKDSSA